MVISISSLVQDIIDRDLSLQDALQRGYGNYSAIARMLRPKVVDALGRDVKLEGAEGCSLVSASYQVGQIQGTIGILGPTRMEYAKVVSIVDYMAKLLSEDMEG